MKPNKSGNPLPSSISHKLRAIRRRERMLSFSEGILWTGAVLLGALFLAMVLDWVMGWFAWGARHAVTFAVLGASAAAFALWVARPLLKARTLASTAREVDATLPELEERWSTVAELAQNQDAPEIRGSEALIQKVQSEAEAAETKINPGQLLPASGLRRAGGWFLATAALVGFLFALNSTQASLLWKRFWNPGANLSLTRIRATPDDLWVPKGEALQVRAVLEGRLPKAPAQIWIRDEKHGLKIASMTALAGAAGQFQFTLPEVSDSLEYRIRAGDGQTAWHRVTAVERPVITAVNLRVTPPSYSGLPKEEKEALPPSVQVLQGSEVELRFRSDQPLDRMVFNLGDDQSIRLTPLVDSWFQFRSRPTNSLSFTVAAFNRYQLQNKNKPVSRIHVYEDQPPAVQVLEPSDEHAVLPEEKVRVTFAAQDDFGLAKAEIIVTAQKANGETNTVSIPIPLGAEAGNKQIQKTVELNPKALGLNHGDQLSYVVQVTDSKQNPTQGAAEAKGAPSDTQTQTAAAANSQNGAPTPDADDAAAAASDPLEKPPGAEENTDTAQASPKPSAPSEAESKEASTSAQEQASSGSQASALAKAGDPKSSDSKPASASGPPPNDMTKRALDVAQTSACQPRNIMVDEWAGRFEGEKRRKLEIAIDPVLKRLDELLANAQAQTDSLKTPAAAEGLQPAHAAPLNASKASLAEAEAAIADLKARTSGTPYAFIGLQLHDIGAAHLKPASQSLGRIELRADAAKGNIGEIDQASFHITRAREKLAGLTKSYETVKRDQQVAEALQKLNKMYQIFIEDTQALLGNSKGPINSYDRKIAEVDEAFVEKLRELLEEKKKIMAELAKLLGEDPRLLRRYLAMMQLQGTSYRDVMTLLAERQKKLSEQISLWNATAEAGRPALLARFQTDYASGQQKVVEDAAKLRENLETWLPLDVKPETEPVPALFRQAEQIARLVSSPETPGSTQPSPRAQALDQLRALRDALPSLNGIPSTNEAKMASFIANRLTEVESLITAQSGQMKVMESLGQGDFLKTAEITQHRLTQETADLREKLDAVEKQVASMSSEIAEKAAALNKIVEEEIVRPQLTSVDRLAQREIQPADELLQGVVPAFARGEKTFDELMRLIIAKMDQAPAPNAPGEAPELESILAMLEDEMKAAEGLGIPCRPLNVSVMNDWMKPGSGQSPGQGQGRAQAQAARGQAKQAQAQAGRLEKAARDQARNSLARAGQGSGSGETADIQSEGSNAKADNWNKLASKLRKDLLQGRENMPPEQYRAAIENYFKVISESNASGER